MSTVRQERNELVVKSNELLRNTRYELTVSEQKILVYIISKLKADDIEIPIIKIGIKDYSRVAGISDYGSSYENIKHSIKSLADKSWWIPLKNKQITLFRWFDSVVITEGNGVIEIRLKEELKPYLLELKENFTKYDLINVLALKGKYSIRLYEIFKSYLWVSTWRTDVNELRSILLLNDKYKAYKEFKRNVLVPAVEEINLYTDLSVSFTEEKAGRRIEKIKFHIEEKMGAENFLKVMARQDKRLGER